MVTFLDFERAVNEQAVVLLKKRQVLVKARRKIHDEKASGKKKRNSKAIRRINFD